MLPQLRRLYQDSKRYYRCIYSSITGELNQFFTSCKNTKNEGFILNLSSRSSKISYYHWRQLAINILHRFATLTFITLLSDCLHRWRGISVFYYVGRPALRATPLHSGTSYQRVQLGSFGIMLLPRNWTVIMCCLGYLPTSLFRAVLPFSYRAETKTAKSYKRYCLPTHTRLSTC